MFFDFIPTVVPLRAIAFQIVFLLMAIAIEATVIHRQLDYPAKQSVQFSTSINLLATVLGWLAIFFLLGTSPALPAPLLNELKIALLNFIFFDQWTNGTAELLILICFVTFFASLIVKWLGLVGLDLLMDKKAPKAPDEPSDEPGGVFVSPRRKPRLYRPRLSATLVANAWSYGAILVALLLRVLFQAADTTTLGG
jgi:hypothetical protein